MPMIAVGWRDALAPTRECVSCPPRRDAPPSFFVNDSNGSDDHMREFIIPTHSNRAQDRSGT